MINIDLEKAIRKLEQRKNDLLEYKTIMSLVQKENISENTTFRKSFDHFYVIRRNIEWRNKYYHFLENNKTNKNISFEEILKHLNSFNNWVEASYSSKMLATINDQKPIWDRLVLKSVNLKVPTGKKEIKLQKTIEMYDCLEKMYENYMGSEEASKCIAKFDSTFNEYKDISNVKKIDFLLWANGME